MDLKKIQKQLEDALQAGLKKVGVVASGSSFFAGTRKGENAELHADLNSNSRTKQANALKRIIANMSLGRDVSQLFTDVVKLGQCKDLEIKKLVYLYVLSNARLQPDKALLAVNTFLLDCHTNASPIIRALAIRTMLCLRVDSVLDYLVEPLKRALTVDGDPYVRKTAAIGVLKLFHQSPRVMEDHGFLPILVQMVGDTNNVVASNAAAALHEIIMHRSPSSAPVALPPRWADKLLHTLSDCSEWGQVYVLDLLAAHHEPAEDQIEMTIERIVPRLSHINAAVVLAAVKCILQLTRRVPSEQQRAAYLARVNSALTTLSRTDPDTQYIVIKNIQSLLPVYPGLLRDKIDGFFVRFNDPLCVKREKLRLLMMLMHEANAEKIVKELAEYATDVDHAFLSRVIHAIAVASIKQASVAPRCVELLHNIAENQKDMLPFIFVAAKNLLRRHPSMAQDLMKPLLGGGCGSSNSNNNRSSAAASSSSSSSSTTLNIAPSVEGDQDATVALVWILGEFCDVLPNGMAALDHFTSNFPALEPAVQNAVMTALVKLFLRNPAQVERLLTPLFESATKASLDPDVRDRAFMYWRLLAKGIGVERMKGVVHSSTNVIDVDERSRHSRLTPTEVLAALNSAATALERPAKSFLLPYGLRAQEDPLDDDEDGTGTGGANALPPVEYDGTAKQHQHTSNSGSNNNAAGAARGASNIAGASNNKSLDELFTPDAPQQQQKKPAAPGGGGGFDDIFAPGPPSSSASPNVPAPQLDPFASVAAAAARPAQQQPQQQQPQQRGADPFDAMFSGGSQAQQQQQQQQHQKKPLTADDLFA